MTIVAFAGPSLSAADRAAFPAIDWRPPAEAGDLLLLAPGEISALCLIDGYFDHRPAVRHKEILLLLSQGVRIFGASSIGALRAAEMAPFGMIGVGAIFAGYARGTIRGDDEVALIHAGPEQDWRALSVPLVDIRATLCRARREGMIGRSDARALLEAAAAIHYIDRDWASLGAAAARLKTGAVSQKREDAIACIRAAAEPAGPWERPALVHTCFLDTLARERGAASPA